MNDVWNCKPDITVCVSDQPFQVFLHFLTPIAINVNQNSNPNIIW